MPRYIRIDVLTINNHTRRNSIYTNFFTLPLYLTIFSDKRIVMKYNSTQYIYIKYLFMFFIKR